MITEQRKHIHVGFSGRVSLCIVLESLHFGCIFPVLLVLYSGGADRGRPLVPVRGRVFLQAFLCFLFFLCFFVVFPREFRVCVSLVCFSWQWRDCIRPRQNMGRGVGGAGLYQLAEARTPCFVVVDEVVEEGFSDYLMLHFQHKTSNGPYGHRIGARGSGPRQKVAH